MNCNLCGSDDLKLVIKGNLDKANLERFSQYSSYGNLYQCNNCGLVVQELEHSIDDILSFLKNEKYLDEEIGTLNVEEKGTQFRKLISLMKKTADLENACVLDVGANTGVFLNEMKRYSKNVSGIEPSEEAAQAARTMFNHDVQSAFISSAQIENKAFDIITMWDVIEHLHDPKNDLGILFEKLKPGGIVYITTHDVSDWFAKMMGAQYPAYMYQHFYHFSHRTLSLMLENQGFKVVDLKRFCKSWSFAYIYQMLKKIWPESIIISLIRGIMKPALNVQGIAQFQVAIPVWNFFLIAAQRPAD